MSQKEYLDKNNNVGIVGGYLDFFSDRCEYISTRKYPETDSEIRNIIFRYTPVAQPAAMIRKECFDNVGYFDEKIPVAEDLDMNFRIGEQYQFANLQEPVIRYRLNDASSTFKRLRKIEINTIKIRRKYFDNPKYKVKISDKIYNVLQYISIYLIPAKLKITIFNFLRNTK
jgi:GT2 family glycosyltransferase